MTRRAVVAGSFDPITNGHLDIIARGTILFDEVVVACGHNVNKKTLFDIEERIELIYACTGHLPDVKVEAFSGLLVDYCVEVGADVILRGLRATSDFDFEFQIGLANMDMAPAVQTVFLLSPPSNIFVSSSLVKEIAMNDGDVSRYVPAAVHEALRAKLSA